MRRMGILAMALLLGGAALAGGLLLGEGAAARIVLAGGVLGELFLWGLYFFRREREVERLTEYVTMLQDDPQLPRLEKHGEGSLGILESELYKLVVCLREESDLAGREQRYLADMLSDISHQIKTPLTAITIMTDLLKEPEVSKEHRMEFAGKIDSQAGRITWLIQTLLTLSRLEAQVLTLKKEEIPVEELAKRAVSPLEILAELKGVELIIRPWTRTAGENGAGQEGQTQDEEQTGAQAGQREEERKLVCDIRWTGEALSNIVKNCIEHTPEGGRVELSFVQNNFSTDIYIRDNGEGISQKDLPHIFERFYKSEGSGRDSAGIGLALARQIVVMQNGVIEVQSKKGEGTVFAVKFYKDGSRLGGNASGL